MSAGFAPGEEQWRARLGTLRQVVRQEVVARQVAVHLPDLPPRRVLDIGCGQGTQALLLARRGHFVTGLDSSAQLLGDFRAGLAAEPPEVGARVRLVQGEASATTDLFAPSSFDAVLCQGVLMYFPDPNPLLDAIAQVVAPGGLVSLLVRNGDALAMRPGLLGDWESVGQAFDGDSYLNRIGVDARADRLADLTAALAMRQMPLAHWYGVRVFTDAAASDAPLPDAATLDAILRYEERAGRTDPYRHVAALLHLIAVRSRLRSSGSLALARECGQAGPGGEGGADRKAAADGRRPCRWSDCGSGGALASPSDCFGQESRQVDREAEVFEAVRVPVFFQVKEARFPMSRAVLGFPPPKQTKHSAPASAFRRPGGP